MSNLHNILFIEENILLDKALRLTENGISFGYSYGLCDCSLHIGIHMTPFRLVDVFSFWHVPLTPSMDVHIS